MLCPDHQFSQRIWYVECCSACAHGVKSEISLDIDDSASNSVVKLSVSSVFINQHWAECVCLCCCEQSFAPWQQATTEIMRRNLSYYCLLALRTQCRYSSRTSRSWLITQSTQHHWRGALWRHRMKLHENFPPEMKSWLRPCRPAPLINTRICATDQY